MLVTLLVASSASAMPITIGTTTDKANVFGSLVFDFTGILPTTVDVGTLTITSADPPSPVIASDELDFVAPAATGTLDPTSGQPPFTYVFDIVGGLLSASNDGFIRVEGMGNPNADYLAILSVDAGSGSVVPEPGTLSMLALGGIIGTCSLARRRRS